MRPHRRQPTRLPCPWDSPGKNTGVGCHFLLQCRKVKSESEVVQLCPTLRNPMDYSLPGSSIHGIFQARVLEWGAIAFSGRPVYATPRCECSISEFVVVELQQSCPTNCNPMECSLRGSSVLHFLPEFAGFMSIESVILINHLILCHPLGLLPSIFPSIKAFSKESVLCIRWPKYWSFKINISPSNDYSRLIFFRVDWFDLPAVQGTLKNFLQHHSSKASVLWCSAFFMVQLSHLYMTTGKTIALTGQTFAGKVRLLLFNTLSRLLIAFLPRSKCLLISWLQSLSRVILEPTKRKSVTASTFSPSICMK